MKNLYKNEQSGRSMVEMLGVLAIIGVLSVGGIAGYSKAMAKYKTTQLLDQISMLTANIRTAFASSSSYAGLDAANAIKWGLAPADMVLTKDANQILSNPFLGDVALGPVAVNTVPNMGFAIQHKKLPRDACVAVATAGWGDNGFSGFANGEDIAAAPTTTVTPGDPLTFAEAAALCDADQSNITLFFY